MDQFIILNTSQRQNKTLGGEEPGFQEKCSKQRYGCYIDLNPIFDKSEVVSGDYCRISINFGAYNVTGSKGVSAYLCNIQFVRKGEPLGGRTSATTDFSNSTEEDFL